MDGGVPRGFSVAPWLALRVRHFVSEPPYARLLRTLGLFDPIEAPAAGDGLHRGAYPAAVHVASTPWAHQGRSDVGVAESLERLSDDLARDGSRIVAALGSVFDETARWAMGGVIGPLRSAADHIESQLQRESRQGEEPCPGTSCSGGSNGANNEAWCYYSVQTRTLPDGSVETRQVVRDNDGTERTTVTRRYPGEGEEPAA